MKPTHKFDVIVIGGGHAGCEAAHAAARLGCETALLSMNSARIGFMSCNPAMGGLAKGQLIKEIDALGGLMGRNTDDTAIQYRQLNASKGPAVRSSRAQCDKALYAQSMQAKLATVPRLTVLGVEAKRLLVDGQRVVGIETATGERIEARSVVITTGTFLSAVMHTGFEQTSGGRLGDQASVGLSQSLRDLGFALGRLKTGTPPRLNRRSLDFSKTEEQPGDVNPSPFSFYFSGRRFPVLPQVSCYIVYTNLQTHEIIEENFDRSPMFTGIIQGVGPRYCPSIEDKVKRFRERERHQIFLEPEGLSTDEIYVNGISTSLPRDVQERFVRSIDGLENAKFVRYGYAVEYDCIDARVLKSSLESKDVAGLFFGGQINGTSGYEEAGAQGLIAGINAAHSALNRDPFLLSRMDGYIGVLIDDLVLKGTDEPYRMFTSRAEYRLLLREDNADLRLSPLGHQIGLLSESDFRRFEARRDSIQHFSKSIRETHFMPERTKDWFVGRGLNPLKDRVSAEALLRRPEINWADLCELGLDGIGAAPDVADQVSVQTKYAGYIEREMAVLEGIRRNEAVRIPSDVDLSEIGGLSAEIRDRLRATRPETLGQVSRMPGVTPAAVASIMIHLKMTDRL